MSGFIFIKLRWEFMRKVTIPVLHCVQRGKEGKVEIQMIYCLNSPVILWSALRHSALSPMQQRLALNVLVPCGSEMNLMEI